VNYDVFQDVATKAILEKQQWENPKTGETTTSLGILETVRKISPDEYKENCFNTVIYMIQSSVGDVKGPLVRIT